MKGNVKIPFLAGLFGLLPFSTLPSQAQTDGLNFQSAAVQVWRKQIAAHLASKKAFPLAAIGQSGTAKVAFVIFAKPKPWDAGICRGC